jgi:hypothetical protein
MITLYIIVVGLLIGMVGYLYAINWMVDDSIALADKALGLHYAIASTQAKQNVLKGEELVDRY